MMTVQLPLSPVDVASIRQAVSDKPWPITQAEFAARYGLTVGAVRDWEQGRRLPDAAARTLLVLIAAHPSEVEAAIAVARTEGRL